MRTKVFESRSEPLNEEQILQVIEDNCQTFINGGTHFYRGRKFDYDFCYIDPQHSTRIAAGDVSNHHNMIMSNLPSWKGMPRRDRSAIMTDSPSIARTYGTLYICIPMDDADLGSLWHGDIWASFGSVKNDIPFPTYLSKAMSILGAPADDWDEFSSFMDMMVSFGMPENGTEFQKLWDGLGCPKMNVTTTASPGVVPYTVMNTILKDAMVGTRTWVECLESYFDVNDDTNVGLSVYGSRDKMYGSRNTGHVEWWTEWPCVLVSVYKRRLLKDRFGVRLPEHI